MKESIYIKIIIDFEKFFAHVSVEIIVLYKVHQLYIGSKKFNFYNLMVLYTCIDIRRCGMSVNETTLHHNLLKKKHL